jgi:hypothetical protein
MKCNQLNPIDMARAFQRARDDAQGETVTMEHLAPHLAETGSSCGTCPALLALAQKAFEKHGEDVRTALDVARSSMDEADIPRFDTFIPKGA